MAGDKAFDAADVLVASQLFAEILDADDSLEFAGHEVAEDCHADGHGGEDVLPVAEVGVAIREHYDSGSAQYSSDESFDGFVWRTLDEGSVARFAEQFACP